MPVPPGNIDHRPNAENHGRGAPRAPVGISGGNGGSFRGTPSSRTAAQVMREFLLALAGVLLYFGVRGLMSRSAGAAVDNANDIVRLETSLRFYWEPAWQGLIVNSQALIALANWAYIYLHWPVISAVALWLFLRHRTEYFAYRNAFVISGAIGLTLFVLYPVAPPRLAGLGLTDTVTAHSNAYRVLQPPAFVNQYAAFPSLHFGWNLLIGLAIYENARWRLIRVMGLVLPAIMLFAIIATANHFLIDALAGGILSLGALAAARWIAARARKAERLTADGR